MGGGWAVLFKTLFILEGVGRWRNGELRG